MKIKFPLKMPNDAQVRTIEKLREHFDLAQVLGYYEDGKLAEWLSDRDYKEEAEKVKALDSSSSDFKKSLCHILGVPYSENIDYNLDYAEIVAKNERRERLKQFTAEDDILAAVDMVAFSQEDLAALLNKNAKLIYLCGEGFKIPCSKGGVMYIGVNNPVVDIDKGYDKKRIVFKGVQGANIIKDNIKSVSAASPKSPGGLPNNVGKKAVKNEKINVQPESEQATVEVGKNNVVDQQSFRMTIEDVSSVWGRGAVATGKIELGSIHVGDEIEIVAVNNVYTTIVLAIEMFRRIVDYATVGDDVGLLLRGLKENEIKRGQVITKVRTTKASLVER